MNLQLMGTKVTRCEFENKMAPNMKLNLQIATSNQIKLPKEFRKGSVGTVMTRVMVGSPMEPIYMYMDIVASFMDTEATEETCESYDTMMSLFKTICVPDALRNVEATIRELCKVYHIPEIKMQIKPNV